jgi:hypothetical protein
VSPIFALSEGDNMEHMLWRREDLLAMEGVYSMENCMLGVIALRDCRFLRCKFQRIGWVVNTPMWEDLRRQWGNDFKTVWDEQG